MEERGGEVDERKAGGGVKPKINPTSLAANKLYILSPSITRFLLVIFRLLVFNFFSFLFLYVHFGFSSPHFPNRPLALPPSPSLHTSPFLSPLLTPSPSIPPPLLSSSPSSSPPILLPPPYLRYCKHACFATAEDQSTQDLRLRLAVASKSVVSAGRQ